MDKSYPLSSPIVVYSLEVKMTHFVFKNNNNNEELPGSKVPYLNAIDALMYLVNYTWLDIALFINLLARYCFIPTQSHWNRVKHVLQYFHGTTNIGLFYSKGLESQLFGYTHVGYLSNPNKAWFQMGYVFTYDGTTILCRSVKQTIKTCELPPIKGNVIELYEDNVACITQIKWRFIKGDRTKDISPKFFTLTSFKKKMWN